MDAQQEIRAGKTRLEPELDPVVKASAVVSSGIEKLEQRLHVSFRHRPSIRQPGDPREDPRRAAALFGGALGMPDENSGTGGGRLRRSGTAVRTSNLDHAHAR